MRREGYLADNDVKSFIEWLSLHVHREHFYHKYRMRRPRRDWCCASLSARGKSRQIRADRVDLSGCSVVDFTAWRWARGRRLDRRHRCG